MNTATKTILTLALIAATPAWGQPRQLPKLDPAQLQGGVFDARAFDPLGMPAPQAPAPQTLAAPAPVPPPSRPQASAGMAPERPAGPPLGRPEGPGPALAVAEASPAGALPQGGTARSLFSNGWSRDGFGARR